jgi:two-component system, cell cycle response regulator CtrA
MHILLIEDDLAASWNMQRMLEDRSFQVEAATLGEEGIELARTYSYDLILLDLNLPDISGLQVMLALRDANISTPVVVVSGDCEIETRLKSFARGADDFLAKPVNIDELAARMRAVVCRSKGHSRPDISIGGLTISLEHQWVEVCGSPINLSTKEYQIMEILALRSGSTVTKDAMLNHLYGSRDEPEIKIIDVFICKLRRKLRAALEGESYIETVWGRGYTLREPRVDQPAMPFAA